jgi:hypothetical protein
MAERQSNDPFGNVSSIRDSGPVDHEMNQNIKLGDNQPNIDAKVNLEDTNNTQRTSDTDAWDSALGTLDEPVSETIMRDLNRISRKLKIVVNPFQLGVDQSDVDAEEKRKEIRNWDLWGPFIFCLILSV